MRCKSFRQLILIFLYPNRKFLSQRYADDKAIAKKFKHGTYQEHAFELVVFVYYEKNNHTHAHTYAHAHVYDWCICAKGMKNFNTS